MSLYGHLKTMSLADLFQWLKTSRKSGVLTVQSGEEERSLNFDMGRIHSYTSRELRENLGQLLVGFGLVSESDINQAYRLRRQNGQPLANILIEKGFVQRE